MLKTPSSTVIGGAGIWTPSAWKIGLDVLNLGQLIRNLFSNSEQGFAYDINDLSTLYQDAAGTTPVTGAGQPVGLVKDKSGRNNHAYQTNAASRPLLQRNATTGAYYLAFDGADDFLVTSSIDFTATDKISLFAGVRKLSDVSTGMLAELSTNSDLVYGVFRLSAPALSGASKYAVSSRGTADVVLTAATTDTQFNAPNSAILSAKSQISTDTLLLRVNGSQVAQSAADQGTGNYGNYPLYIGRRGGTSLPFNGHLYSLIGVARLSTDAETTNLEKAIAKNVGVTL